MKVREKWRTTAANAVVEETQTVAPRDVLWHEADLADHLRKGTVNARRVYISAIDGEQVFLVHEAARLGRLDSLKTLAKLAQSKDTPPLPLTPHTRDTPLHCAASHFQPHIIRHLLTKFPSLAKIRNAAGQTAIECASTPPSYATLRMKNVHPEDTSDAAFEAKKADTFRALYGEDGTQGVVAAFLAGMRHTLGEVEGLLAKRLQEDYPAPPFPFLSAFPSSSEKSFALSDAVSANSDRQIKFYSTDSTVPPLLLWLQGLPSVRPSLGYNEGHVTQILKNVKKVLSREVLALQKAKEGGLVEEWMVSLPYECSKEAGLTLDDAMEVLLAGMLYTQDLVDEDNKTLILRDKAILTQGHGSTARSQKLPLYFTMNAAMRHAPTSMLPNEDDITSCTRPPPQSHVIATFSPLMRRLDSLIRVLPKRTTTVFRGISVNVSATYRVGARVVWNGFTSTSLERKSAESFLAAGRDGTFFVVVAKHGAALVDFCSEYKTLERELLYTGNIEFHVAWKLSPTLLRMMGLSFDVVVIQEASTHHDTTASTSPLVKRRTKLSCTQSVATLHEVVGHTVGFFKEYLATYVEGRVGTEEDMPQTMTQALSSFIFSWVSEGGGRARSPICLLGGGGTGKTSAAVAIMSWLVSGNADVGEVEGRAHIHTALHQKGRKRKTMFPVFIPLPVLGGSLLEEDGVDEYVRTSFAIDRDQQDALASEYDVVLILDSLDEIGLPREALKGKVDSCAGGLLSLSPWAFQQCSVVLTSRGEYLKSLEVAPSQICGRRTTQMFLQPFMTCDVGNYIGKYFAALKKKVRIDRKKALPPKVEPPKPEEPPIPFSPTSSELLSPVDANISQLTSSSLGDLGMLSQGSSDMSLFSPISALSDASFSPPTSPTDNELPALKNVPVADAKLGLRPIVKIKRKLNRIKKSHSDAPKALGKAPSGEVKKEDNIEAELPLEDEAEWVSREATLRTKLTEGPWSGIVKNPFMLHMALRASQHINFDAEEALPVNIICEQYLRTKAREGLQRVGADTAVVGNVNSNTNSNNSNSNRKKEKELEDDIESVLQVGELLACNMLLRGEWQGVMHTAVSYAAEHMPKGKRGGSGGDAFIERQFSCLPLRIDDLGDKSSSFTFTHQYLVEFLIARRLCREPVSTLALLDGQNFSKRVPHVLTLFGHEVRRHRSKVEVSGALGKVVRGGVVSRASNAFALLCQCGVLARQDLHSVQVDNVDARHAVLYTSDLTGFRISNSWLDGVVLHGCSLQGSDWTHADFGVAAPSLVLPLGNYNVVPCFAGSQAYLWRNGTLPSAYTLATGRLIPEKENYKPVEAVDSAVLLDRRTFGFIKRPDTEVAQRNTGEFLLLVDVESGEFLSKSLFSERWDTSKMRINPSRTSLLYFDTDNTLLRVALRSGDVERFPLSTVRGSIFFVTEQHVVVDAYTDASRNISSGVLLLSLETNPPTESYINTKASHLKLTPSQRFLVGHNSDNNTCTILALEASDSPEELGGWRFPVTYNDADVSDTKMVVIHRFSSTIAVFDLFSGQMLMRFRQHKPAQVQIFSSGKKSRAMVIGPDGGKSYVQTWDIDVDGKEQVSSDVSHPVTSVLEIKGAILFFWSGLVLILFDLKTSLIVKTIDFLAVFSQTNLDDLKNPERSALSGCGEYVLFLSETHHDVLVLHAVRLSSATIETTIGISALFAEHLGSPLTAWSGAKLSVDSDNNVYVTAFVEWEDNGTSCAEPCILHTNLESCGVQGFLRAGDLQQNVAEDEVHVIKCCAAALCSGLLYVVMDVLEGGSSSAAYSYVVVVDSSPKSALPLPVLQPTQQDDHSIKRAIDSVVAVPDGSNPPASPPQHFMVISTRRGAEGVDMGASRKASLLGGEGENLEEKTHIELWEVRGAAALHVFRIKDIWGRRAMLDLAPHSAFAANSVFFCLPAEHCTQSEHTCPQVYTWDSSGHSGNVHKPASLDTHIKAMTDVYLSSCRRRFCGVNDVGNMVAWDYSPETGASSVTCVLGPRGKRACVSGCAGLESITPEAMREGFFHVVC